VLAAFRAEEIKAHNALERLGLSRARFYKLYANYLGACAHHQEELWTPSVSGGDHAAAWPGVAARSSALSACCLRQDIGLAVSMVQDPNLPPITPLPIAPSSSSPSCHSEPWKLRAAAVRVGVRTKAMLVPRNQAPPSAAHAV